MREIVAMMRWYPGDVLIPMDEGDLQRVAAKCGVKVTMEKIVGSNCYEDGGILREETMDATIEGVTQTVVTVSSEDEAAFRGCVAGIIKMYRAPRTVFALTGSNERGEHIVKEIAEEDDGWM